MLLQDRAVRRSAPRRSALGPPRIVFAAGLIGIHPERLKSEYELLIY